MVWTTSYFAIWPLYLLLRHATAYYEDKSSDYGPKTKALVGHYYSDEVNYQSFRCNISRMEIFEKFTRKLPTWLDYNTTNGYLFGIPQEQDVDSYEMLCVGMGINKFQQEFVCGYYSWTIEVELEARSLSVALRHVFYNATDSVSDKGRFSNCVDRKLVSVATLRVATKSKHATRHLAKLANSISANIGLPLRTIQIVRGESSLPFFKQLKRLNIIHYGELSTKDREDHTHYVSWPLGCGAFLADSFNIHDIHRRSISDTDGVSLNSWHLTTGEIEGGLLVRNRRGVFFGSITALEGTPLETSAMPSLILSSAMFTSLRSSVQESSVITSVSKMFSSVASSVASSFQAYSTLSETIFFPSSHETQYFARSTLASSTLSPSTVFVLSSYSTQVSFNVNATTKVRSSFSAESLSHLSFSITTQSTNLLTTKDGLFPITPSLSLISLSTVVSESVCISAPCSASIIKSSISMSLANSSTMDSKRGTHSLQSSQMLSAPHLTLSQTSSFFSNTSSKTITSTVGLLSSSAVVLTSASSKSSSTTLTVSPTASFQTSTSKLISFLPSSSAVFSKLGTLTESVILSSKASFDIKPTSKAFTQGTVSTTPDRSSLQYKITSRSIFASDSIATNRSDALVSATSIPLLSAETSIQPFTETSKFLSRSFTATPATRVPSRSTMSTMKDFTRHFSSVSSNVSLVTSKLPLTAKSVSLQTTKDYSTEMPKISITRLSTVEVSMPSSIILSSSLHLNTKPLVSTIPNTVTSTAYTSVFPMRSKLSVVSTLFPTSFAASGSLSPLVTELRSQSHLTAYTTAPFESRSVSSYQPSKSASPDIGVSTVGPYSSTKVLTSKFSSLIDRPTIMISSSRRQMSSVQQNIPSKLITTNADSSGSKTVVASEVSFRSSGITSPIEVTVTIPAVPTTTYFSQFHTSSLASDSFKVVSTEKGSASTALSKSISNRSSIGIVLISSVIPASSSKSSSLQVTVPSSPLFTGSFSTILAPSVSTKQASYATSLSVRETFPSLSLFTGIYSTIRASSSSTNQATSSSVSSTLRQNSQSKTESFSSKAFITTLISQASSLSTSYFNVSAHSLLPTLSTVTPNTVITTSLPDTSPVIVNSIGVVFTLVGRFFTYQIPYDTFYDKEDGWTTNLKLTCHYATGTPLPRALWVSFDNATQTLSGLAFVEDYSAQGTAGVRLEIIATDRSGNSARDVFNVYIQNPITVLQFSISARISTSYTTFLMDGSLKRKLFKKIIDFYNATARNFHAISLRNGSAIFSWSDISIAGDTCNTSAIRNNLNKIQLPSGSPTSEFSQALLPEFPLLSLNMSYQGVCVSPTTTPSAPIGPVSGAQTKEIFVRYVVPTLALALLLALIIATFIFISKRRRMKPSFLDKHTFKKGQPILLPEEYELDLYNGPAVTLPEDYAYDEKSLDEQQSDEEPLDYEDATSKNNSIYGLTSFKQPPPPYPLFPGTDGDQSDYESPYARPPPTYTLPPAYFPPDLMTSEV